MDRIDIVGYTFCGQFERAGDDSYILTSLPSGKVYLDNGQQYASGEIRALYLGMIVSGSPHTVLFMLLVEAKQREFRRIGICEVQDEDYHGRVALKQERETIQHRVAPGTTLLEKLRATVKWQREELRLV